METFKVRAKTREACEKRMRELYGERAVAMTHKVIPTGGILGLFSREEVEITGYIPLPAPDLSKYSASILKKPSLVPASVDEEKQKILSAASREMKTDPKILDILNEVRSLNSKLDENIKNTAIDEHKNLVKLDEIMELNDFLPSYRKKIIEKAKKELPFEVIEDFFELQQTVLRWFGEDIGIYEDGGGAGLPRIIILVGPTGVGKTTTIAKLAAAYIKGSVDGAACNVSLITTDKYRVAAAQQLETYAKYMGAPFNIAEDGDSLKRAIALEREGADVILVDTEGRSPHDVTEIAAIQKTLSAAGGKAELYLTVNASTKAADIVDITRQFEPFAYKSVIVTKLDETKRAGNVISALAEKGKSVSFITFGQEPDKLGRARQLAFLLRLDGFDVDRDRLERAFPSAKGMS